jgi:hypothetical protein
MKNIQRMQRYTSAQFSLADSQTQLCDSAPRSTNFPDVSQVLFHKSNKVNLPVL